jgi:hypothetical protein
LPIHDQVNQHHTRSIMLHNTRCCATWLIVYGPLKTVFLKFSCLTLTHNHDCNIRMNLTQHFLYYLYLHNDFRGINMDRNVYSGTQTYFPCCICGVACPVAFDANLNEIQIHCCDVTPCSPIEVNRHFEWTYCLPAPY